jgi:hypothetical protein
MVKVSIILASNFTKKITKMVPHLFRAQGNSPKFSEQLKEHDRSTIRKYQKKHSYHFRQNGKSLHYPSFELQCKLLQFSWKRISNFLWFFIFVARIRFCNCSESLKQSYRASQKCSRKCENGLIYFEPKGILPNFQSSWKSMIDPR